MKISEIIITILVCFVVLLLVVKESNKIQQQNSIEQTIKQIESSL